MMKTDDFLPEGSYGTLPSVRQALRSLEGLRRAQDEGRILEAPALRCTALHDLLFDFGFARGIMPRACCALGVAEGQVREIAVLSRVGKPTCFVVTDIDEESEPPTVWLSRTVVQRRAQEAMLSSLVPGDIIPAVVTHLEPFGAFVDIGCGLPSLIGIENLSVSRIYHPSDRLSVGQSIRAVVRSVDMGTAASRSRTASCLAHGRKMRRCLPPARPCAASSVRSSPTACLSSLRPIFPDWRKTVRA